MEKEESPTLHSGSVTWEDLSQDEKIQKLYEMPLRPSNLRCHCGCGEEMRLLCAWCGGCPRMGHVYNCGG